MTPVDTTAAEVHASLARRELARRCLADMILYTKPDYQMGWFHRNLCSLLDAFLADVEAKRSPRLIIFAPPGHGKSEIVSRRFPARVLGKHPNYEWITATYGQDLADELGRDVRRIIEDPAYQHLFPDFKIRDDSNALADWQTTQGGKYRGVGVGGALTGKRAHILSIDDPVKGRAEADSEAYQKQCFEWYLSVARTRLYPGGGILATQTPWSLHDTTQRLLEMAALNPKADQWCLYKFPAIAIEDEKYRKKGEALHPERYSLDELEVLRATYQTTGNSREWNALYQCNPTPDDGNIFKKEWFRYHKPGHEPKNLVHYGGTDFAIDEKRHNDYTVFADAGVDENGVLYFTEFFRAKKHPYESIEDMLDLAQRHRQFSIAIENIHITKTVGPHLRKRIDERRINVGLEPISVHKDKVARAGSLRARLQQGKISFPDTPFTHEILVPEFLQMPAGKHDDIVDACAVLCQMIDELVTPGAPPAPPKPSAPAYSHEWIQKYARKVGPGDAGLPDHSARTHVPHTLTGRERKTCDRLELARGGSRFFRG